MVEPLNFKLGKLPAQVDDRNLKFASLLRPRAVAPISYDVDYWFIPRPHTPMYANDRYGDCVIAGRAHHTLRFEAIESGLWVPITDKEVTTEYFKQTGGRDSGLYILQSLKLWKSQGWIAGKAVHFIEAYAQIAVKQEEISLAISSSCGVEVGVNLPISAQDQLSAGKPWTVTTGSRSQPGTWGGHLMLMTAYDRDGLTAITWGKRQKMTWAWFLKYCDEAYAIFDAVNRVNPLNINPNKIVDFLQKPPKIA